MRVKFKLTVLTTMFATLGIFVIGGSSQATQKRFNPDGSFWLIGAAPNGLPSKRSIEGAPAACPRALGAAHTLAGGGIFGLPRPTAAAVAGNLTYGQSQAGS